MTYREYNIENGIFFGNILNEEQDRRKNMIQHLQFFPHRTRDDLLEIRFRDSINWLKIGCNVVYFGCE